MNIQKIKKNIRDILVQFDCAHLLDDDKIIVRHCSLLPIVVATTLEIKSPYGHDLYLINISPIHWPIVSQKMRSNVIAHETCHVLVSHLYGTIDFGGDNHGKEWQNFMSKLGEKPNISYSFSDEEIEKIRVKEILKIKRESPWFSVANISQLLEISPKYLRRLLRDHIGKEWSDFPKYRFFVTCFCGKPIEISKRKANSIKHGKYYRCSKCKGFLYNVMAIPIKEEE